MSISTNNDLIYGKGDIVGIVSIEDTKDGFIEVFTQTTSGEISSQKIPYEYWILTNQKGDEFSQKLLGNGHYKYKNPFTLREDFEYAKKCLRAEQAQGNAFWVNDIKEQFMISTGETYYKGLQHKDVSVLSFDIETTGLEHNEDSKVLLISNTFRDSQGKVTRKLFCYDDYDSPGSMFEDWCTWVHDCDPSILLGHNIFSYDLPYLDYCASNCNQQLLLGRDESELRFNSWTSKKRKDSTQMYEYTKCYAYGIEIVDTFFLALSYDIGRKYESYGLKSIIEHEGLEVKDRVFYDASLIRKNYQNPVEWEKIKQYAMHDADDALALWDLMGPSTFYWSQKVPKPIQEIICGATGSQLNAMMIRSYFQEGYGLPKASPASEYEGAISKGVPGIWKHGIKFDIASLYPSIVLQYEIFDRQKDPKGNFYQIVKTLREYRLEHKKLAKETGDQYYNNLQESEKVGVNSAYGFMGSVGLLFNSPQNAARITELGRDILLKAIQWSKNKGLTLINADTDSILCTQDNQPLSKLVQSELLADLNSLFPEYIRFEFDGYFPAMIILKIKNYVLKDESGKVKKKGSSITDKKREPALREFIDGVIKIMLEDGNHERLQELYTQYAKEIMNVTDIKRWCNKKTVTEAIFKSERTNETKIRDIIEGTDYRIADKIYCFFKSDNSLCLVENFDGDYSKTQLLKKLFNTVKIFNKVLPEVKTLFPNYSLKRSQKLLETL